MFSNDETTDRARNAGMRVGLGQFMQPTPERLRYAKQLGVDDVLLNMYAYDPEYPHMPDGEEPALEGEREWTRENLVELREYIESFGLRLNAIENVPIRFYDDIMLGREGREEQIEHMKNTVCAIGEAGIPHFGYHWMPSGVWRNTTAPLRGGAEGTGFDRASVDDALTHDREYTEAELWENYEYFLEELLPVAEDAGVRMCLHPNDPPVETLGGIPQLFRNFENFRRAMELVPSDNHGLEFCLGCWSEMGADLAMVIDFFGSRDELFYVHFRDVTGAVPSFHEAFVDEGNYDTHEVMGRLREVGFDGMLIPDHVPELEGDTDWSHRGRAHAVGYLQSALEGTSRGEE
jgi:mannonate dehydratase